MISPIKVSVAGAIVAALAGCANMGSPDGNYDNSAYRLDQQGVPNPELPNVTEKIELQIPFDQWELTAEHKAELAGFLKNLRSATTNRPAVTVDAVVVTGHTDRIGPLPYNMKISERLAEMARDHLVNAGGIDPALIFWEGKGPKEPIPVTRFCDTTMAPKQLIDCLAPNRRVTVEVVGTALPHATIKAATHLVGTTP